MTVEKLVLWPSARDGHPTPLAGRRERTRAFDGLRGSACLLVVLSHLSTIVPAQTIAESGALHGFFLAGTLGVNVFLVLGAFLVTRGLIEGAGLAPSRSLGRFWVRRLLRLGPQLIVLVAVLFVIALFDSWDTWTAAQTRRSAIGLLTFTYNWWLVNDPFGVRGDVGHLWYLSAEQQCYVVLVPVVLLCWRFRVTLAIALVAGATAVIVWRFHVLDERSWWPASLKTTTRSDGILLGAAAAVITPQLRRWRFWAARVTMPSVVALVVLVLAIPQQGPYGFLEYPGVVSAVVITLLVLAIAVADNPAGRAERWLSWRPLRVAGGVSYPLYLWHLPIFFAAARWLADWSWQARTVVTAVVLMVVVALTDRFIERPIRRRLRPSGGH